MLHGPQTRRRRVRVAFLTPTLLAGGAERWVVTLANHFRRCEAVGVAIVHGDVRPGLAQRCLAPVFHGPDAVSEATCEADIAVAWGLSDLPDIAATLTIPVVEVAHGAANLASGLAGSSWQGANFLAAVSEGAAESFPEPIRRQHPVTVIPNGIELDRIAPRVGRTQHRAALGIDARQRLLLYLGRLAPEKNPHALIQALAGLPEHWLGLTVGDGPLKREVKLEAARMVPGRLIMAEPVEHVGDFLAAADCLLLPSDTEAMPLTIIEAWGAGLPTVSSDLPGLRALAETLSVAPTTVPPRATTEQLAAAVEAAILTPAPELSFRRSVVCEHFSASAMAARWELFLMQCVSDWISAQLWPRMNLVTSASNTAAVA